MNCTTELTWSVKLVKCEPVHTGELRIWILNSKYRVSHIDHQILAWILQILSGSSLNFLRSNPLILILPLTVLWVPDNLLVKK